MRKTDEELFVTYTSPQADLEKLKELGQNVVAEQVDQLQEYWNSDPDRDAPSIAAAILRHVDYLLSVRT